jgi:magnesium-transporting ATPase (P-type)
MDNIKHEAEKHGKKTLNNFIINTLLLFSGILVIISGLTVQLGYHTGGPDGPHEYGYEAHSRQGNFEEGKPMQYEQERGIDTTKTVWGLRYAGWAAVHKYAIFFFSLFMLYHIYAHWKWFKVVIIRHLISKNIQVTILSILFLLVALTGLIPWFIDLSGSISLLRMLFIELHDKLALVLIIFLILHLVKRTKWYMLTYKKLKDILFTP